MEFCRSDECCQLHHCIGKNFTGQLTPHPNGLARRNNQASVGAEIRDSGNNVLYIYTHGVCVWCGIYEILVLHMYKPVSETLMFICYT